MVLNTKDFDINILHYCNYYSLNSIDDFKSVLQIKRKIFGVNYVYNGYCIELENADFLYLGSRDNFYEELESRKYDSNFSNLKKVNFSENATFPRSKLSVKGIKRCNDLKNADVLVCDDIRIEMQASIRCIPISKNEDFVVLQSPSTNKYFIFNCYLSTTNGHYMYNNFRKVVNLFDGRTIDSFDSFINFLIDTKLIPEDCIEIYRGPIVLFRNKADCNTLIKIFNTDKKIIYSKDLDEYCSEELTELDLDGFESIKSMILSSDKATIALGLKLLCSSNFKKIKNSVIFFVQKRFGIIRDNSYFYSSSFISFLNRIGLQYDRYCCKKFTLSELYKTAVGEDKDNILKEIYKEVESEKNKFMTKIKSNNYDFLDIKIEIKLKDE